MYYNLVYIMYVIGSGEHVDEWTRSSSSEEEQNKRREDQKTSPPPM